jgi:D-glycero-D-manno-heptose 1,7-bisphosphate phosphatase
MSASALRRCLFLDRDGVVNESVVRQGKPFPPADWSEIRYVDGIQELCAAAHTAGWMVIIATNQPDVGRGTTPQETVEEIHRHMVRDLELDDVEVSYDPGQGVPSEFRKPAPGMLLRAAAKHGIDLSASVMIGDRWRDVSCGKAAGCRTVFIDYGYDESLREAPDFTVPSLAEASALLRGNFF